VTVVELSDLDARYFVFFSDALDRNGLYCVGVQVYLFDFDLFSIVHLEKDAGSCEAEQVFTTGCSCLNGSERELFGDGLSIPFLDLSITLRKEILVVGVLQTHVLHHLEHLSGLAKCSFFELF